MGEGATPTLCTTRMPACNPIRLHSLLIWQFGGATKRRIDSPPKDAHLLLAGLEAAANAIQAHLRPVLPLLIRRSFRGHIITIT